MKRMLFFFVVAAGLACSLSAWANLQDVLCRPAGHCPNAPDGVNKDH